MNNWTIKQTATEAIVCNNGVEVRSFRNLCEAVDCQMRAEYNDSLNAECGA